jgi:hypothetical protein
VVADRGKLDLIAVLRCASTTWLAASLRPTMA